MWMTSLVLTVLFPVTTLAGGAVIRPSSQNVFQLEPSTMDLKPVDVKLFVMSRCPDGQYCESVWGEVLDIIKSGPSKVDIHLDYIATANETATYGAVCKHGDIECLGNIQQLCFQDIFDRPTWWEIISCQNQEERSNIGTEAQARRCVKAATRDYDRDGVKECVESGRGQELFLKSIERTAQWKVEKSCTVFINGKFSCVYDDSTWKNCTSGHRVGDFVKQVDEAFKEINGIVQN